MNAKKKLLGGMSLNWQAIAVGGINKGTTGMPVGLFSMLQDEFLGRIKKAYNLLESCCVCPRNCKVNRLKNQKGFCQEGLELRVSSFHPHFGEEDVLVGQRGSGTIFLAGCNLGCIFCQNYTISHLREGKLAKKQEFVDMMLALQKMCCHNINFVTPTHFTPQILDAIYSAKIQGLNLPLVYNCGGYESVQTLKLLDGIIDIYMPDAKYASSEVAGELANAPDYPWVMKEALREMHSQAGDLTIDKNCIAKKGLLIRHLVMPDNLAGTRDIMHFIATEVSKNTYVNIMDQYRPCYEAASHPKINRMITQKEFDEAVSIAKDEGLHRGF